MDVSPSPFQKPRQSADYLMTKHGINSIQTIKDIIEILTLTRNLQRHTKVMFCLMKIFSKLMNDLTKRHSDDNSFAPNLHLEILDPFPFTMTAYISQKTKIKYHKV